MVTLIQALLIGLVAAATRLDDLILGECKLREPIITGFLVGLILGDVEKGLIIGAQLQLMWMGATGIGATAQLDIGTGGTVGAAVAIATGTGVESAIMFGVPISILVQFLNTLLQTAYSGAMLVADKQIERLNTMGLRAILWGCAGFTMFLYFLLVFLLMFVGGDLIDSIANGLPAWASAGLNGVAAILPALGFALLMNIIMDKSLVPYFILGFVPCAFVGFDLNMLGMAAVAVAIALIIFQIRNERASASPATAVASSDDEWED